MKKYFLYELKKNALSALIITVFACAIYLVGVLTANFEPIEYPYDNMGGMRTIIPNSLISIPLITLMVLCTLIPILMFSFKMSSRQADCFYSMPIRREKVYLVKSAVGLLLAVVPYTVAYWLGFVVTACKPNGFLLSAFVPVFFISLPLAVVLFGINAFVFTRANRPIDGVIFIALYSCAGAMLMGSVFRFIASFSSEKVYSIYNYLGTDFSSWFTYSPLSWLTSKYTGIISRKTPTYKFEWLLYLFAGVTGAAAWAGLFLTARSEKAENAERVSDSWFGYKVLVPFYLVFALSFLDLYAQGGSAANGLSYTGLVMFAAGGLVGYIIFRRTILLKAADWLSLLGAFILGICLSFVLWR